jgi:hypothetical protein
LGENSDFRAPAGFSTGQDVKVVNQSQGVGGVIVRLDVAAFAV